MKSIFLAILMFFAGLIVPAYCVIRSIEFRQECSGYLRQAADANTVELASERLGMAVNYIEEHEMTSGYTSVVWRTEDENVGYWYRNIKACQAELEAAVDGTQLEKSNVLMKVRESLTDGEKLTIPHGISRFPYNTLFGILRLVSYLLLAAGIVKFSVWYDEEF